MKNQVRFSVEETNTQSDLGTINTVQSNDEYNLHYQPPLKRISLVHNNINFTVSVDLPAIDSSFINGVVSLPYTVVYIEGKYNIINMAEKDVLLDEGVRSIPHELTDGIFYYEDVFIDAEVPLLKKYLFLDKQCETIELGEFDYLARMEFEYVEDTFVINICNDFGKNVKKIEITEDTYEIWGLLHNSTQE